MGEREGEGGREGRRKDGGNDNIVIRGNYEHQLTHALLPSLPPPLTLVSLVFDKPANKLLPHEAVLVVDKVVGVGANEATAVSDLTHQSS